MVAAGHEHLFGHLLLGLQHGAAQVASPDAELDGDVALLALAVDEGRPRRVGDIRNVGQRNLDDTPIRPRRADGDAADLLQAGAVLGIEAHHDREVAVAAGLIEVARRLAADGRLHGVVHIARGQAVAGGAVAVDGDLHRGLAERVEDGQVGDAGHARQRRLELGRGLLQRAEVGPEQLERVLALHAGRRLFHVVLDGLGEVELHPREGALQFAVQGLGQLGLVDPFRPGAEGLERNEELGVEEAGGVSAVVGPAMLRHDRDHLGVLLDHRADAVDVVVPGFERS